MLLCVNGDTFVYSVMKKLFTISIALIYFAVSSGIIVNMHYCMGKFSGVSYQSTDSNHCHTCGMTDSDCCHNNIQVVKLADAQNTVAAVHFELPSIQPLIVEHYTIDHLFYDDHVNKVYASVNAPPDKISHSRNILYCTFRI